MYLPEANGQNLWIWSCENLGALDLVKRNFFRQLFFRLNSSGIRIRRNDNWKGYVSRNQAVNLVRNKLAAWANSSSSSGPVLPWFAAIKSWRIFDRTLLDPWSHCCNNFVTDAWSLFMLKIGNMQGRSSTCSWSWSWRDSTLICQTGT